MEAEKIEIKVFVFALLAIVIVELITGKVIAKDKFFLIQGAARLIDIILIILIVTFWGRGLPSIGLAKSDLMKGIKRGLLWSAGFGAITVAGFLALYLANINPFKLIRANLPTSPGEIASLFLIAGVVAPIAEELLFRGIFYGFFRRWGVITALILSTAIFVLLHSASGIPVTQIVGGIVFAIAYEIEKNLMVPIIIHTLGNSAIFALSLIPVV